MAGDEQGPRVEVLLRRRLRTTCLSAVLRQPVDEELSNSVFGPPPMRRAPKTVSPGYSWSSGSPQLREGIGNLMRRVWRAGDGSGRRNACRPPFSGTSTRAPRVGSPPRRWSSSSAVTVASGSSPRCPPPSSRPTQNLLLAATALGLGSAMTTLATLLADELASLLDLPPTVVPMAVDPSDGPADPSVRLAASPAERTTGTIMAGSGEWASHQRPIDDLPTS